MTEKTLDKEMDALKADIASLREELSGLDARVKKNTGTKAAENDAEGCHNATEQRGPDEGEQDHDMLMELLRAFDTSRAQHEKIVKNLAAEVERHPLVSIVAAVGLGYIIAKLWHQGDNQ